MTEIRSSKPMVIEYLKFEIYLLFGACYLRFVLARYSNN